MSPQEEARHLTVFIVGLYVSVASSGHKVALEVGVKCCVVVYLATARNFQAELGRIVLCVNEKFNTRGGF